MSRIVEAHLIPWEPGTPGISFRGDVRCPPPVGASDPGSAASERRRSRRTAAAIGGRQIVPDAGGWPRYFVLCDYGPKLGQSWYEMDPAKADRETVLEWLIQVQFTDPVQVMEVNLPAGTSRDVSAEFAEEVRARSNGYVAEDTKRFVENAA